MTTTATKPTAKELRAAAKDLRIEGWEEMTLADLRAAVAEAQTETSTSKKRPVKKAAPKKAAAPEPEDDEDEDIDEDADEDEDDEEEAPAPRKTAKKAAPAKTAAPAKKTASKAAAPAKKAPSKRAAAVEEEDGDEVPENGNPYKPGTNMFIIAEEVIAGGKRSQMVKRLKKKITINGRDGREVDVDAELDRRILIVGQNLRKDHGFEVTREGRGTDATIVAVKG